MYTYKSLEPGCIRVFKIAKGEDDEEIKCSLIHIPLRFGPPSPIRHTFPYVALSYTWGPQQPQKQIEIDGEKFMVRENLFQLLQQLRHDGHDYYFWADAISINQSYVDEKTHQVASMSTIFNFASCMIVWLGPAADNSVLVMELLAPLLLGSHNLFLGIRRQRCAIEKLPVCEAVAAICRRPYWQRAWVMQEIAFSGDDVFVLCGSSLTAYRKLMACIDLVRMHIDESDPEVAPALKAQNDSAREEIKAIVEELDNFKPPLTNDQGGLSHRFSDLMIKHADTLCEDPRDKVFAFRLMAADLAHTPDRLRINYSKSVIAVFLEVLTCFDSQKDDPWGVPLPQYGRTLLGGMSLSLDEVRTYLEAPNTTDSGQERGPDEERATVMFEVIGHITDVCPLAPVSPTRVPEDIWVTFKIEDRFKFKSREKPKHGVATTQVQFGDWVYQACGSDIALIVRHTDCKEIESWSVISSTPDWTPCEADLTRAWRLHDRPGLGDMTELNKEWSDLFRLMLRPRWLMSLRLSEVLTLIEGAKLPEKDKKPSSRTRPSDLWRDYNWRGYEWPAAYFWLSSMWDRCERIKRLVQAQFWRIRYRILTMLNYRQSSISQTHSRPPTPTYDLKTPETRNADRALQRRSPPVPDTQTMADAWMRHQQLSRFRAGSDLVV